MHILFQKYPDHLVEDKVKYGYGDNTIIVPTNIINNTKQSITTTPINIEICERQFHINKKIKLAINTNVTNIVSGVNINDKMSIVNMNESVHNNDITTIKDNVNKHKDFINKQSHNEINVIKVKSNIVNNSNYLIDHRKLKKSVSWSPSLCHFITQGKQTEHREERKRLAPPECHKHMEDDKSKSKIKWSIRNNNVDYHLSDLRESKEDILEHIVQMATVYSPLITTRSTIKQSTEEITSKKNAFKTYLEELSLIYGTGCLEAKAEKAAKEMNIVPESLTKDSEELKADGSDLLTFIKKRMELNKTVNLSGKSIKAVIPSSDPEYEKAYNIAENGVLITFDEGFIKQTTPIPMRPLQQRIPTTILALAVKLFKNNQGLIFKWKDLSPEDRDLLHFSSLHWRGEYAKILGRLLFDLSNSDVDGYLALNEGTAKQEAIDRWAVVDLETIFQWIEKWLIYNKTNNCTWKDCLIGNDDVKGAFPRLNFEPSSAVLVAATIVIDEKDKDNNLIYINTSGAMGWTGTPMAFEAVSRPLARVIQSQITCPLGRYVDDYNVYGKPIHIVKDKQCLQNSIRATFGPDAIAEEKDELGNEADLLAWRVNLLKGEIRPKDKAISKLTFIFFMFDLDVAQPLKLWECIMSLTNYYAKGIRGAISFIKPFQTMTGLAHSGNRTAIATPATKFAIEQWRIMLFTLFMDKESLSIPIEVFNINNNPLFKLNESIHDNTTNLIVQGDAGPDQLAIGIYCNITKELISWTTYKLPYPEWDNVNCHTYYEYLVFMLSQILIFILYPNNSNIIVTYQWKNDNTAALAWAAQHACGSGASQFACVTVNWLQIISNILMIKPIFISGIDMADIDRASRNMLAPSLTPSKYINIQDNKTINEIFDITSPYNKTPYTKEHHLLYLKIHKLISQLDNTTL